MWDIHKFCYSSSFENGKQRQMMLCMNWLTFGLTQTQLHSPWVSHSCGDWSPGDPGSVPKDCCLLSSGVLITEQSCECKIRVTTHMLWWSQGILLCKFIYHRDTAMQTICLFVSVLCSCVAWRALSWRESLVSAAESNCSGRCCKNIFWLLLTQMSKLYQPSLLASITFPGK